MRTDIELAFADGQYRFALGLAQIQEIQTKCGPIGAVYARVLAGRMAEDRTVGHPAYAAYDVGDLVEVVRQGLIGGGEGFVDGQAVQVTALRANELVQRYGPGAPGVPLSQLWQLAASVLFALIEGYEPAKQEVKKKPRKATTR